MIVAYLNVQGWMPEGQCPESVQNSCALSIFLIHVCLSFHEHISFYLNLFILAFRHFTFLKELLRPSSRLLAARAEHHRASTAYKQVCTSGFKSGLHPHYSVAYIYRIYSLYS